MAADSPQEEIHNPTTRISTGIMGLDDILHGGFLRNGFYLLQGHPGAGKTTLTLQFLLHCVAQGDRALYITLTETAEDLALTARSHGWSLDQVNICDLSASEENLKADAQYTIFHPAEIELGETTKTILSEVDRISPTVVVFDGLSEVRLLSRDALRYRRQMLTLKQYFAEKKITALVLDDRAATSIELQPESLVSGNIVLEQETPEYGTTRRRLRVTKFRGSDFRSGYHDYEIVTGGVVVHPRLVATEHHKEFVREPLASTIPGLDTMLKGGLDPGTTTLIMGPAGVGKSTIALQYVAAALQQGQRAAVYTFDEVLNTLFHRAEKLCRSGLREYAKQGALHVQQVDAAELTPGSFAEEIRRAVEEMGASVVVIDSLNGYMNSMPEERFLAMHLHELFTYLNQQGIVTIVVAAQHGIVGTMQSPIDISYLADSVLIMRYYEMSAEIRQAISVFKKRGGPHERAIRELRIDTEGITVGEPLLQFRGIMTGVPQYGENMATGSRETQA